MADVPPMRVERKSPPAGRHHITAYFVLVLRARPVRRFLDGGFDSPHAGERLFAKAPRAKAPHLKTPLRCRSAQTLADRAGRVVSQKGRSVRDRTDVVRGNG
jgi:hypothetical protein